MARQPFKTASGRTTMRGWSRDVITGRRSRDDAAVKSTSRRLASRNEDSFRQAGRRSQCTTR